jgi:hypothetical protein
MSRTRECRCTCDGFAMVLRVGSFLAHLGTGAAAGWGFLIARDRFNKDENGPGSVTADLSKTAQYLNESFAVFQGIMAAYYWCVVCVCHPAAPRASAPMGRAALVSRARAWLTRHWEPRRVAAAPTRRNMSASHRADVSSCTDCLCSVFAIIGMLSEIRSKWLRGNVLKHLNFLTSYFGRACFMIYIGA